jgi:hypothetical protein
MAAQDQHCPNIEQRLTALERRANSYRNSFVLLVVAVAGVVLIGATTADDVADVVRTKRLEVLNEAGKIAIAAVTQNGNGLLGIYSEAESPLIFAGAGPGGHGTLIINSKTRQPIATVGGMNGHGLLQVNSETGETVISLSGEGSGEALLSVNGSLHLNSETGEAMVVAGTGEETGNGMLVIASKTGHPLVSVASTLTGDGLLSVSSKTQMPLFVATANPHNGDGVLVVNSKTGNQVFQVGGVETGGHIILKNKTGEGVISLYADEYGNGVVGAYNRKGEGRTLTPGP